MRESERRFRLIAENTGDVIWQLDLVSLKFTYVSPSVERLRGYTPEEVLAQPIENGANPRIPSSWSPRALRRIWPYPRGVLNPRNSAHPS